MGEASAVAEVVARQLEGPLQPVQPVDSAETIDSLYVTDASRHLIGMLSLRDLVTADPEDRLGDVMTREVMSVSTDTDQEEVALVIQRYDFLAVPVVDREERLVGIVTVDDVITTATDVAGVFINLRTAQLLLSRLGPG